MLRALVGKRGAVPGEEKWVTEEEVAELLDSATATGIFTKTTLQLRAMLARHRHWEATVRVAVVGALLCSDSICGDHGHARWRLQDTARTEQRKCARCRCVST